MTCSEGAAPAGGRLAQLVRVLLWYRTMSPRTPTPLDPLDHPPVPDGTDTPLCEEATRRASKTTRPPLVVPPALPSEPTRPSWVRPRRPKWLGRARQKAAHPQQAGTPVPAR